MAATATKNAPLLHSYQKQTTQTRLYNIVHDRDRRPPGALYLGGGGQKGDGNRLA